MCANLLFLDLLKPNSSESLNRRSWEASKLDTQIEEEPLEINYNVKEVIKSSEEEEKPKEEQLGMFSKLMNMRKGVVYVIDSRLFSNGGKNIVGKKRKIYWTMSQYFFHILLISQFYSNVFHIFNCVNYFKSSCFGYIYKNWYSSSGSVFQIFICIYIIMMEH